MSQITSTATQALMPCRARRPPTRHIRAHQPAPVDSPANRPVAECGDERSDMTVGTTPRAPSSSSSPCIMNERVPHRAVRSGPVAATPPHPAWAEDSRSQVAAPDAPQRPVDDSSIGCRGVPENARRTGGDSRPNASPTRRSRTLCRCPSQPSWCGNLSMCP
jgi:hypothetical protein